MTLPIPLEIPETPIYIDYGYTFRPYPLALKDSTGAIINLAGYTAFMNIRAAEDPTSRLYYQMQTGDAKGTITIDAANGIVTLYIPASDTKFPWKGGYYDLKLVQPNGDDLKIQRGPVYIRPSVT